MKKLSLARCCPGARRGKNRSKNAVPDPPAIYAEPALSEKIPIKYACKVEDSRFDQHLVYEAYRPRNLREMQDFLHFVLKFRKILPNCCDKYEAGVANYSELERQRTGKDVDDVLSNTEVSKEIRDYYNSEVDSKLPPQLGTEKMRLEI